MILNYHFKKQKIHNHTHDFKFYNTYKDSTCGADYRDRMYKCSKCGLYLSVVYRIRRGKYSYIISGANLYADIDNWLMISNETLPTCSQVIMERACG